MSKPHSPHLSLSDFERAVAALGGEVPAVVASRVVRVGDAIELALAGLAVLLQAVGHRAVPVEFAKRLVVSAPAALLQMFGG